METYNKQQGSAGFAGQFYEIVLAILFLLRGTIAMKKGHIESFRLASNMKEAHPFDDIVFEYKKGGESHLILLQAKHRLNQPSITRNRLFENKHKENPFQISKYLDGFLKMKSDDKFKGPYASIEHVLYTNVPLKQNKENPFYEDMEPNQFYRMGDKKVGKIILNDEIRKNLGNGSANIDDFFKNFVLAYNQPYHNDLEKLIKEEIASFYEISERDAETIYSELYVQVKNWWDSSKPCFLNEQKDWFDSSRNNLSQPLLSHYTDLMKKKLENTGIEYKSTDELEECIKKSNQIISVDCDEKTSLLSFVKVYHTLKTCHPNKYILLDDTSYGNVKSQVLEAFKGHCSLLAICSSRPIPNELIQIVQNNEDKVIIWIGPAQSGLSTISLKVGFSHLKDEVKMKIKINRQGKLVPLVELVDDSDCDEIITDDLLVDLMTSSFQQYRSDENRPEVGKIFVLICAYPGMGKWTLVSSMSGEKSLWKFIMNLREHFKFLEKLQNTEASLFLKDAIKSIDLDYKLFKLAYEHEGGMILFFCGFDEIIPDYKDKVLQLFQSSKSSIDPDYKDVLQLFQSLKSSIDPDFKDKVLQLFQSLKSSKVDEVWLTTRPGYESELETSLNTEALPFTLDGQIYFLKNIWNDADDNALENILTRAFLAQIHYTR